MCIYKYTMRPATLAMAAMPIPYSSGREPTLEPEVLEVEVDEAVAEETLEVVVELDLTELEVVPVLLPVMSSQIWEETFLVAVVSGQQGCGARRRGKHPGRRQGRRRSLSEKDLLPISEAEQDSVRQVVALVVMAASLSHWQV